MLFDIEKPGKYCKLSLIETIDVCEDVYLELSNSNISSTSTALAMRSIANYFGWLANEVIIASKYLEQLKVTPKQVIAQGKTANPELQKWLIKDSEPASKNDEKV